jgi:hypothetical protein
VDFGEILNRDPPAFLPQLGRVGQRPLGGR